MASLHDNIKAEIPDEENSMWFSSVPDAVAACRRYFMNGGKLSCRVYQDSLIYTIDVQPNWNGKTLP
jgi:hypothetical protein